MADLRSVPVLVKTDPELSKKHTTVIINQKLSTIKKLQLALEDLKNIEQKRIELQIETLEKEVENMQEERDSIIEVKYKEKK